MLKSAELENYNSDIKSKYEANLQILDQVKEEKKKVEKTI